MESDVNLGDDVVVGHGKVNRGLEVLHRKTRVNLTVLHYDTEPKQMFGRAMLDSNLNIVVREHNTIRADHLFEMLAHFLKVYSP